MTQGRLTVVPCTVRQAQAYVAQFHRHHGPARGARFALAITDESGAIRGVAMCGRPVARLLDDGWTIEVNRVATDGVENGCSALYGAARRVARELGYARLITYIREDEPGTSLKAAGWVFEGTSPPVSWACGKRPRVDKTDVVGRGRWSADLREPATVTWPTTDDTPASLFDEDVA